MTAMEHHANLVPWQLVCEQTGATLRAVPITDRGELDLDAFERLLTDRARLFAVGHVSNALGTVNPVRELAARARAAGALVLVDGAQSAPHLPVDVAGAGLRLLRLLGPQDVRPHRRRRALRAERRSSQAMPPVAGRRRHDRAGDARAVHLGPAAGAVRGGHPADRRGHRPGGRDRLRRERSGLDAIGGWERELLARATERVGALPGVRLIGTAPEKAGVLSFVLEGIHPHDVGTVLDDEGVAVRAGHHCAQPVMQRFGIPATVRASFAFYNTADEIDVLVRGVERAREVFG